MTASLMLVTFNRLELTKKMLNSLFENTLGEYRLIIVDNGSTDGTVEYLKNIKTSLFDLKLNEKNLGIAIGRNQCLKIANKYNDEWLSTLDNDIELPYNWLQNCIDIIQSNSKLSIGLNMEGIPYRLVNWNNKIFQLKPKGNLGTACTVFHRDLHNKIGFFNTEYGKYGEEDADFFFRARLAGYQLGYLKDMGIHLGQGEIDTGPYREFKNECHAKNLVKFRQNCFDYSNNRKNIYLHFDD